MPCSRGKRVHTRICFIVFIRRACIHTTTVVTNGRVESFDDYRILYARIVMKISAFAGRKKKEEEEMTKTT